MTTDRAVRTGAVRGRAAVAALVVLVALTAFAAWWAGRSRAPLAGGGGARSSGAAAIEVLAPEPTRTPTTTPAPAQLGDAIERSRDGATAPLAATRERADPDAQSDLADENARLRDEIARLRDELAEARRRLAGEDPRLRRIADHLAANELRLAKEWRALLEASLDGEALAADPARAFEPLLALLRASGIAAAPLEGTQRSIAPEPAAPRAQLAVSRNPSIETFVRDGVADRSREYEQLAVDVDFILDRVPAGWLGDPIAFELDLQLTWRDDGGLEFSLSTDGAREAGGANGRFFLDLDLAESTLERVPWRGGKESREPDPGEFAALRAQLESLLRELRTLAG